MKIQYCDASHENIGNIVTRVLDYLYRNAQTRLLYLGNVNTYYSYTNFYGMK